MEKKDQVTVVGMRRLALVLSVLCVFFLLAGLGIGYYAGTLYVRANYAEGKLIGASEQLAAQQVIGSDLIRYGLRQSYLLEALYRDRMSGGRERVLERDNLLIIPKAWSHCTFATCPVNSDDFYIFEVIYDASHDTYNIVPTFEEHDHPELKDSGMLLDDGNDAKVPRCPNGSCAG